MATLRAEVVWQADGRTLDARLLGLLRALERHPTLKAAADEAGLSYRGAWGLLLEGAGLAGAPLADLQRGRGARLTALGTRLLRSDERLRRAMTPLRERFEVAPSALRAAPLRLAASHDPLLAEFCERFAAPAGLIGELSFRGSEESLALFSRGAIEMAGFHLDGAGVRRYVRPGRDVLVRFAAREQGLIVAAGNPRRLHTLQEVAARHARFVNRQRGSGTRRHVDRLLEEAGVAPDALRGYGTEEHTHLAVAATVATGRADAGFGVHAAAAQFGLDFVPVLREQYWLALRSATLGSVPAQRLLEALSGKALARVARKFPGYELAGAGSVVDPREASAA
ncbi:MAG: substrate-binding domain-containing protein [Betaproteobacteria bacterium]